MQILGNIFNAIIFVSAIGGIFCVLSLFINHTGNAKELIEV